jgi:cytochrome subunit of sulfide dehydrogenase
MSRILFSVCTFCALAFNSALAHEGHENLSARALTANCASCHGTNGKAQAGMARLAGTDKTYFIEQMQNFKSGKRPATLMHQIAKGFDDKQITQMAEYFAAQK